MEIYNTTWWGNAIDTAITAGTEPDFFGSQMKMLTSQQPELVTNGDFATDSDWIKGTGWTISGGVATQSGGSSTLQQSEVLTANKRYKLTFEITQRTSGSVRCYFGGVYTTYRSSIGTYTEYVTSGSISTFFVRGNAAFIGSIDNVSIKLARAEEVEAVKCLADWIHTTALQDLNN
jgi:hypothetical protein